MKKSVLNTALSTAFIVALGFGISACSGDKEGESHEVLAKDRVDEAAELARKNAPAAEEMDFPETAPMPAVDATTDATMSTEEGVAAVEGTEADAVASAADTAVATAEMPAPDAAATEAEPATN